MGEVREGYGRGGDHCCVDVLRDSRLSGMDGAGGFGWKVFEQTSHCTVDI